MDRTDSRSAFTIHNSNVEFVVVGPKGKRDGVLVRSDNVRTDLIGFASTGHTQRDIDATSVFRRHLGPSRRMWSVDSFPLDRTGHEWDERKSEYRFCWVGPCSEFERNTIRNTFNRYVADLQAGIEEGALEQVEWSIAPVVLDCAVAQARGKFRRRMLVFFTGAYAVIGVAAFVIWALRALPH